MVADLFHYGHVNFLRQAREHGDYLLVGVHADETVMSYKRRPIFSMEERVASEAWVEDPGRDDLDRLQESIQSLRLIGIRQIPPRLLDGVV